MHMTTIMAEGKNELNSLFERERGEWTKLV